MTGCATLGRWARRGPRGMTCDHRIDLLLGATAGEYDRRPVMAKVPWPEPLAGLGALEVVDGRGAHPASALLTTGCCPTFAPTGRPWRWRPLTPEPRPRPGRQAGVGCGS